MAKRSGKITEVDVFGVRYTIRRVPGDHVDLQDSEGNSGNNGMHIPDVPAISLDNSMSDERERITVAHELTHAIEHHFGLDLPEDVVDAMGRGWLYLLRHNAPLIKYLTRKEPAEPVQLENAP